MLIPFLLLISLLIMFMFCCQDVKSPYTKRSLILLTSETILSSRVYFFNIYIYPIIRISNVAEQDTFLWLLLMTDCMWSVFSIRMFDAG